MAGERTEDHVVAIGELDEELLDKQPPANGHGARGGGACADGRSTVRRRQRHGGRWSDTRNQPQVAEPLEAPGGMRGASARLPFRGKPLMPCRALCCAATQGDEHPLGVNGSSAPVAQPAQRGGLRAATSNAYRMTKEATIAGSFIARVEIASGYTVKYIYIYITVCPLAISTPAHVSRLPADIRPRSLSKRTRACVAPRASPAGVRVKAGSSSGFRVDCSQRGLLLRGPRCVVCKTRAALKTGR